MKILFAQRFLHPSCTLAHNSEIKKINISAGIENTNSQQTFACVSLRYRTLHPPQNLRRPLKTFACVSLRYRKRRGGVDGNTGSGLW